MRFSGDAALTCAFVCLVFVPLSIWINYLSNICIYIYTRTHTHTLYTYTYIYTYGVYAYNSCKFKSALQLLINCNG